MYSVKTKRRFIDHLSIVDKVNEWCGKFVSFAILIMMIIIVYEVVLRYGFNAPTFWVHETASMLFATYVVLGAGYTIRRGASPEHIRMDVIFSRFSQKAKTIINLISTIIFFLFIGVVVWKGSTMALKSVKLSEHTFTLWSPPIYPVKLCLAIGASLLFIQGLINFIRDITALFSRGDNK
jgi:TRAP-type mannitol/chloroaromatic compound transport system permease small subunit